MASVPPLAREAIILARQGDFVQALDRAKRALAEHSNDMGLQLFVGMLHARRMELDQALPHFRKAHALAPDDVAARLELARTLLGLGQVEQAEVLLDTATVRSRDGRKLLAALRSDKGDISGATKLLQALVDEDANDFEAWSNLGVNLLTGGDYDAAVKALGQSLQLRPDRPQVWEKWADAHFAAGTGESALLELGEWSRRAPNDAGLLVTQARLEDLLGRPDAALVSLERALQNAPVSAEAMIASAELYERQNDLDRFGEMVGRLEAIDPGSSRLPLLKAELALRDKRFDDALQLAERASPRVLAGTRARIVGEVYDRRGESGLAWSAFSTMNREDSAAFPRALGEGRDYRRKLDDDLHTITPSWFERWKEVRPPRERPVFLTGFPRSGTTLLDTFLMGHPDVAVSEEHPLLETVSQAAGAVRALGEKSPADVKALRQLYDDVADKYVPDRRQRLFVDKLPFALVAAPLIHRLFPGAPILFMVRHPCDVVLSCYFTRFRPSGPAAAFLDIVDAARLYDSMMTYFARCRDVLPLNVHEVRYERLVEDAPGELRKAATFLGLGWSDELVANREIAMRRGFIGTPSYAQVGEALYTRSIARWARYRREMIDALPILEPWAARLGYEV